MDVMQMITQQGFAVGVAAFLLVRLDTTIKANTLALQAVLQRLESVK